MKKIMVMWLIVSDEVETRSVFDAMYAVMPWINAAGYECSVSDGEIELTYDYYGNDELLLYEALKWGRAEQALAPMCQSINIGFAAKFEELEKQNEQ